MHILRVSLCEPFLKSDLQGQAMLKQKLIKHARTHKKTNFRRASSFSIVLAKAYNARKCSVVSSTSLYDLLRHLRTKNGFLFGTLLYMRAKNESQKAQVISWLIAQATITQSRAKNNLVKAAIDKPIAVFTVYN